MAGKSGGSLTKERVRGQWSQLDCRSTPSRGPVKLLSLSQGLKKALGEVARCWRGLHPGGTWHWENSASRAVDGGKENQQTQDNKPFPSAKSLQYLLLAELNTVSASKGERMQDAGPLAQMKGVFGAEKQHVENRHISLVPPYSLKALNTIYPLTVAPHSSILAWKIPWMEEPDRLQFMGSLRVGHD